MVKTLRYSLMAVVAMVANFSFAQTTIDFKQQTVTKTQTEAGKDAGYTLTAEGYTFTADKADGTTVPTQNTTSKDLRHYAKNTLTISGPAMKEIVFTMSAAGLKQWGDVTPSEGQVTVDTENGITTWTNTNGSTTVTFTVGTDNTYGSNKSKKAGQFDLASVTISGDAGQGGETKQPANLAFSETTIDHEVGTEFTAPTFTKETTAAVTFVSDNEAVATVNAEGVIALGNEEGKAVITATSEENDTYSAGNATCTVYVWHYNVYKKAAAIESGKQYLIVAQRDGKTYYAIPAKESYNYGYLSTFNVEGTVDELQIKSSYDDSFAFETLDDGFSIKDCYGRYLYMDTEHNSFQFNKEKSEAWTVEADENGTFSITNNGKFIQFGSGTFTSFGAYDKLQENAVLPMLFVLNDNESGINGVTNDNTVKNGARYNLAGQRVSKSYKGIVIENGKKFVVK